MKNAFRYVWAALSVLMTVSLALAQSETPAKSADAADTIEAKEVKTIPYPLDYCLVTGEKLGSMGDPVVKTYDGREIRFCCSGCVKPFEKDKAKWVKKLETAVIALQKDTYPMQTCIVSGEKLGTMGDPVEYLYRNRLVEFCCSGCISTFTKEPGKYIAMLDAAAKAKMEPSEAPAPSTTTP